MYLYLILFLLLLLLFLLFLFFFFPFFFLFFSIFIFFLLFFFVFFVPQLELQGSLFWWDFCYMWPPHTWSHLSCGCARYMYTWHVSYFSALLAMCLLTNMLFVLCVAGWADNSRLVWRLLRDVLPWPSDGSAAPAAEMMAGAAIVSCGQWSSSINTRNHVDVISFSSSRDGVGSGEQCPQWWCPGKVKIVLEVQSSLFHRVCLSGGAQGRWRLSLRCRAACSIVSASVVVPREGEDCPCGAEQLVPSCLLQ